MEDNTNLEKLSDLTKPSVSGDKNLDEEGVVDNVGFTCENVGRVFGKVGHIMANLSLVYFLEYTITTSFTVANA